MVHQRDLRGEERVLADEALGAVDRVDEPQVIGILLRPTGLFTVEPVVRKLGEDDLADGLLALDVGLGNRRPVVLGRHREIAGIVRTADVGRLARSRDGDAQVRGRGIFVILSHGRTMAGSTSRHKHLS